MCIADPWANAIRLRRGKRPTHKAAQAKAAKAYVLDLRQITFIPVTI